MTELFCYCITFGLAGAYATFLHHLDRRYEPDWTIATVVGGVALTGGGVAIRLALFDLPHLAGAAAYWWVWWLFVTHFAASGLAIALWQAYTAWQRIDRRIAYLMGSRRRSTHGDSPDEAESVATPRARDS